MALQMWFATTRALIGNGVRRLRNGKKFTLGRALRDKRKAEWRCKKCGSSPG